MDESCNAVCLIITLMKMQFTETGAGLFVKSMLCEQYSSSSSPLPRNISMELQGYGKRIQPQTVPFTRDQDPIRVCPLGNQKCLVLALYHSRNIVYLNIYPSMPGNWSRGLSVQ